MKLIDTIKDKSTSLFKEVQNIRHHLHMHPELSFEEKETSMFVKNKLNEMGIEYKDGIGGYGIVATIKGKQNGPNVALRADMDALPIQEENDIPYRSKREGVMHACGHDVHTSSLLGAAAILNELKDQFNGSVKFIFQPAEEKLPGGASLMIKEGALKNPETKSIIGQHVMPFIDTGKVGIRSGVYMASTDELYITIKGKGGHGAMPHLAIDPVYIASNLIVSLQQIISRRAKPIMPCVLSFGRFEALGATNVIPDKAILHGTFRTLDETWRVRAHEMITEMCHALVESMGATCNLEIRKGYPVLINEENLTKRCRTAMEDYMEKENVQPLDVWMAAEDFSYYSHEIPACFYRLGTRNEKKGIVSSVHTSTFNIDEDALVTGMGLMAYLALSELNQMV
ncbi:MAG TPA: M20 family metallopeptidase [Bacteroidia bacterium]|nr:M20 family metallopeptidase [Bacteroidia bacterium]HNT80412.1 M20 family metallopeptidase [Bacteroidia bacterium]